ncbi:hypothetical protein BT93_B1018 [Corymbia citriodora subsp. variegata]|nr:hypothetical protein BT93_B1018 [Corymbia citriodora subsp. variegata]
MHFVPNTYMFTYVGHACLLLCKMMDYLLSKCLISLLQINYFPSRYDPIRQAERYPIPTTMLTGKREKVRFLGSLLLDQRPIVLRCFHGDIDGIDSGSPVDNQLNRNEWCD